MTKRKASDAGFEQLYRKSGYKKKRTFTTPKKKQPKTNLRTGGYTGVSKKYVDSWNTGTAIPNNTTCASGEIDASTGVGALSQLCGVIASASETGRTGDKVRYTSLHVTGTVSCAAQADQTSTDVGTKVYVAIVLDTQTNGVQLNSEDVFTNPSATATLCANPIRDMQYSKRFKVVKTKKFYFDNPSITWDGTNIEQSGFCQDLDMYVNLDVIQQYTDANGTGLVTGVLDNSFHLIAFTNSTALTPTIQYNCRARFIDMN